MMMKSLLVSGGLVVMSATAGWLSWVVRGEPDRSVKCVAELLAENEICLADVPVEGVIWLDARKRGKWISNGLPDSFLLTDSSEEDWDQQVDDLINQVGLLIAQAEVSLFVVYCNTHGCGSSHTVAEKLAELGLGVEIKILHGGWKALAAEGLTSGASRSR